MEKQKVDYEIINDQNDLKNVISDTIETNISIQIPKKNKNKLFLFKDIPFKLLYSECIELNLSIKGVISNQEDFDEFCNTLSKYEVLKIFSFRFYNRKIQNLDELFFNISDLNEVNLDLQNFKKISLEADYENIWFEYKIKRLNINLKNAVIQQQSVKKFGRFFEALKSLEHLDINMDKQCSLKILKRLHQNVKIIFNFEKCNVTQDSCDQLIQLVKNRRDKYVIESNNICYSLKYYLDDQCVDIDGGSLDEISPHRCCSRSNRYYLNDLQEKDYYSNILIDLLTSSARYDKSISISTNQMQNVFKHMINILDKLFTQIFIGNSQDKEFKKQNNYNWSIIINDDAKDGKLLKFLNNILYLDLKFKITNNQSYNKNIFLFLMKQHYLLCLKTPQNITDKKLDGLIKIKKANSQIMLSYIVYKKNIYNILPLPNQIFYDLLIND